MRISDEIVQLGLNAGYPQGWDLQDKVRVLSIIAAVLPKLMMKVPELDWVNGTANTSFGDYDVYRDEDEDMADYPICASHPDGIIGHYPDEGEAKAAAQADYERCMLQGLEIVRAATVTDDGTKAVDVAAVRAMPERIWTCNETRNIWIGENQDDTTEYIRADIAATIRALPDEPASLKTCEKAQTDHSRIAQLECALTSILFEDSDKSERQRMIDRVKARAVLEAAEPAQGDQWQPIEAAPKDTMLILACANWPLMVKGRAVPIKIGGYWDDKWNVFGASWAPTHWMHLPAAPTTEAGR